MTAEQQVHQPRQQEEGELITDDDDNDNDGGDDKGRGRKCEGKELNLASCG